MALAGEAGEVIEHFQWLTAEQSMALPPASREEVAFELADVLLYLVRLGDVLKVNLADAARRKMVLNAQRIWSSAPAAARTSTTACRRVPRLLFGTSFTLGRGKISETIRAFL